MGVLAVEVVPEEVVPDEVVPDEVVVLPVVGTGGSRLVDPVEDGVVEDELEDDEVLDEAVEVEVPLVAVVPDGSEAPLGPLALDVDAELASRATKGSLAVMLPSPNGEGVAEGTALLPEAGALEIGEEWGTDT